MSKSFTAKVKYIFRGKGLPLSHEDELRRGLISLLSYKLESDEPTDEDLRSNQLQYKFLE